MKKIVKLILNQLEKLKINQPGDDNDNDDDDINGDNYDILREKGKHNIHKRFSSVFIIHSE